MNAGLLALGLVSAAVFGWAVPELTVRTWAWLTGRKFTAS